jgi:hypothetical protein
MNSIESLPDFVKGSHYREYTPREGGYRYRYVTTEDIEIMFIHPLVYRGYKIDFKDLDGRIWMSIYPHKIVISKNYAWDGCTPKRWWGIWWGVPDFKETVLASLIHDALLQFENTKHSPFGRYEIDNYFKFRKKTIRSKLANIEHSRWVSNQIIDLGYIPMKKSHLLDLIEQKIKKIKNNDYPILEIDEEVDEIRRYNISLTDYENITKIRDLIHNYLINNELLEYIDHKKIKVRVDYYFKNFRLMDSLKVLFPFIDEENEDDIKMKNKSEYYIVKKQIETIVKEEI